MPLARFQATHFEGPPPSARTLKRWPAATRQGGRWYIDLDQLAIRACAQDLVAELEADPRVAALAALE